MTEELRVHEAEKRRRHLSRNGALKIDGHEFGRGVG